MSGLRNAHSATKLKQLRQLGPYTVVSGPMNLLVSTPPIVSSPFKELNDVVGSKAMPTILLGMSPPAKAVSMIVGVPEVEGPILQNKYDTSGRQSVSSHSKLECNLPKKTTSTTNRRGVPGDTHGLTSNHQASYCDGFGDQMPCESM